MDDDKNTVESRYSWHACWHDDAWRGIEFMPPDIVGVYWRIILMMYRHRSALRDDDETLAMACFTSVKTYRRAKKALLDADRIEIDEENGLLYCKRAIKQLVKDQRFKETQGRRGKKGGRPTLVIGNVTPFPIRDNGDLEARSGATSSRVERGFSGDNSTIDIENKGKRKTPAKATHTHTHIDNLPAAPNPEAAPPDPRAGSPLTGASAPPAQREDRSTWSPEKIRAWKEAQLAGLAASDPEALAKAHELGQSPTGDRKARRTNG